MELSERMRRIIKSDISLLALKDEILMATNEVAQLEEELRIEKQKHLDTSNWAVEQQDRANQLEADNKRYLEALRSIAGTNTKPSHLEYAWKEMLLVAKQRAKQALGGE